MAARAGHTFPTQGRGEAPAQPGQTAGAEARDTSRALSGPGLQRGASSEHRDPAQDLYWAPPQGWAPLLRSPPGLTAGLGLPSATPRAGPAGLVLRMRCPSSRHGSRRTAGAVASPRSYWLTRPSLKRLGQLPLARVGEREG